MKSEKLIKLRDKVGYIIKVAFGIGMAFLIFIIGLVIWIPFFPISLIAWFLSNKSFTEIHGDYKDGVMGAVGDFIEEL